MKRRKGVGTEAVQLAAVVQGVKERAEVVLREHVKWENYPGAAVKFCEKCDQRWPCDAAQLAQRVLEVK